MWGGYGRSAVRLNPLPTLPRSTWGGRKVASPSRLRRLRAGLGFGFFEEGVGLGVAGTAGGAGGGDGGVVVGGCGEEVGKGLVVACFAELGVTLKGRIEPSERFGE